MHNTHAFSPIAHSSVQAQSPRAGHHLPQRRPAKETQCRIPHKPLRKPRRYHEGLHRGSVGKLGQYMVQHALNRGYEVVGVCREQSVPKLDRFKGRITVMAGPNG